MAEVAGGEAYRVPLTRSAALLVTPQTGELDLAQGGLTYARPLGDPIPDPDPAAPSAEWEMSVRVDGHEVDLEGTWLSFAWLGRLAGWSAPDA